MKCKADRSCSQSKLAYYKKLKSEKSLGLFAVIYLYTKGFRSLSRQTTRLLLIQNMLLCNYISNALPFWLSFSIYQSFYQWITEFDKVKLSLYLYVSYYKYTVLLYIFFACIVSNVVLDLWMGGKSYCISIDVKKQRLWQ